MAERGEKIKAERRRRDSDSLAGKRKRLALNMSELDTENYVYRLVNDEGSRIYDLTHNDDYDVVTDRDGKIRYGAASAGSEVALDTGGASGKMRSVLLRKPKHYHIDDQAAKQRHIDETEAAMKGGITPGGDNTNTYTPGKRDALSISVER